MKPKSSLPPEDPIRPHVFDGIQEYDKRLPNWWLMSLYLSIAFALGYWAWYDWLKVGVTETQSLEIAMSAIETRRLATATIDDASLWKMSQNATFVAAGKTTFDTNCAACHLASLRGKTENAAAIGPDLTDPIWIHGGKPTEINDTIMKGIIAKGMPTWGPVLGAKKVSEITAYILSKHREGEAVVTADVAVK